MRDLRIFNHKFILLESILFLVSIPWQNSIHLSWMFLFINVSMSFHQVSETKTKKQVFLVEIICDKYHSYLFASYQIRNRFCGRLFWNLQKKAECIRHTFCKFFANMYIFAKNLPNVRPMHSALFLQGYKKVFCKIDDRFDQKQHLVGVQNKRLRSRF